MTLVTDLDISAETLWIFDSEGKKIFLKGCLSPENSLFLEYYSGNSKKDKNPLKYIDALNKALDALREQQVDSEFYRKMQLLDEVAIQAKEFRSSQPSSKQLTETEPELSYKEQISAIIEKAKIGYKVMQQKLKEENLRKNAEAKLDEKDSAKIKIPDMTLREIVLEGIRRNLIKEYICNSIGNYEVVLHDGSKSVVVAANKIAWIEWLSRQDKVVIDTSSV